MKSLNKRYPSPRTGPQKIPAQNLQWCLGHMIGWNHELHNFQEEDALLLIHFVGSISRISFSVLKFVSERVSSISIQAFFNVPFSIRRFGRLCSKSSHIPCSFLYWTYFISIPHELVGRKDQTPPHKSFSISKLNMLKICGAKTIILEIYGF